MRHSPARYILPVLALLAADAVVAQERKVELAVFAGGYWSAGYDSLDSGTGFAIQPVGETSSGIFGVRGSYGATPHLAIEATVAFSPAGRRLPSFSEEFRFLDTPEFLPPGFILPILPQPVLVGNHTLSYSGNAVFQWRKASGWTPFLTAGLGAITRSEEVMVPEFTFGNVTIPGFSSKESITNISLNFGGGVKRYLGERWGIRLDLRNYISQPGGDTVNNVEVSAGVILRM